MKTYATTILTTTMMTGFVLGWTGCSSNEEGTTGDDQNVTGAACTVSNELSGGNADLSKLNDPVGKLILQRASSCPQTFAEVQQHLNQVDDCSGTPRGLVTRLISETAHLTGQVAESYRSAITRACNGRKAHELLMSTFITPNALSEDVELMGLDPETGAYNYYALEGRRWKFFGSSRDFVKGGYDCDGNGICKPRAAEKTRCAGCHTGGGLVMKELDFPWVHWNGKGKMPGADEIFAKFGNVLGSPGSGLDFERVVVGGGGGGGPTAVEGGNSIWGKKRPNEVSSGGVAEVLRPLFCTVEINLMTHQPPFQAQEPAGAPPKFSFDLLFNTRQWGAPQPFVTADYGSLISAFGQNVNAKKDGKGAKLGADTVFPFIFPKRSDADGRHARELLEQGFIDADFLADVTVIDFARPIFSPTRCGLLKFAPQLSFNDMTPANIKAGFIKNLQASAGGPGESELLTNLQNPNDATAHRDRVNAFFQACSEREPFNLTWDALTWATHLRNIARTMEVIETGPMMPIGTPVDENLQPLKTPKGWNTATCVLE